MTQIGPEPPQEGGNACAFCRRRKRSCDKRLPRCSACSSRNLESGIEQPFPAVYFMDHRVFQHSRMQLPKTNWAAPAILIEYVREPLSLAQEYWNKVHWWMPIISKKRFYDHSLNPLVQQGVDVVLLLSAMKLVVWHPGQTPRPEAQHRAIRHAFVEAENAGILTLQLLQAKILVTIYEFGHAIYPAAYLSVGSSALEIEEKKRSWWAVLILDRTMQLGNPSQMLCTEEPDSTSYLPVDDMSYESGVHGNFRNSERLQLDRTLRALLNLLHVEGSVKVLPICAQSSICYSALFALHDPDAKRADPEYMDFAISLLKPVVHEMTWASGIWFHERLVSVADASPLLLFWAFQAITLYCRLEGQYGYEVEQHMLLMREKLRIMSLRWKAGGMNLFVSTFVSLLISFRSVYGDPTSERDHDDVIDAYY
ncbi:hypothetical protein K402DRAFT_437571 [Aulographum hederae CBS 113979]|uniref:Zn(2)-C6 fungal-type domain-containing protein n=1 Tax=Aulographum hederae CBS 113979 TaxID=1176131 RepID=A0A6G1GP84_9PEZI|nr:hypothetical protein K402DRAFT_437571 [Aulographum hederae CBS 113979]